jgi:hypothetical protein
LSDFNFSIEYRSGTYNAAADASSRNLVEGASSESDIEEDNLTINTQQELLLEGRENTVSLPNIFVTAMHESTQMETVEAAIHEVRINSIPDLPTSHILKLQI